MGVSANSQMAETVISKDRMYTLKQRLNVPESCQFRFLSKATLGGQG